jgi:hypothetical protein
MNPNTLTFARRTTAAIGVASLSAAAQSGPVIDAFGDAVPVFGEPTPLIDIDTLDVRYDATDLYITMTFHTPIAPASAGRPNSLVGLIELDTDENPDTGVEAVQNMYAPPFAPVGLGVDYFCDFFTEHDTPGFISILKHPLHEPVATVPVEFTERSVRFAVPLATLGGDGRLNFTATVGTFDQPTDAMDTIGRSVPGPTALAFVATAGLLAPRRRR